MEIGPVPGIRALPVSKTPPVDPRLSAVFDIENFSKAGDDTYSGSGKRATGGQDDETDEMKEGVEPESPVQTVIDGSGPSISFFA